jgi:hypothetical protein
LILTRKIRRNKEFLFEIFKEIEETIARMKSAGKPENAEFRIRKTQVSITLFRIYIYIFM